MIQDFADWLVYKILEFTPHTQLGEAVNFFVYDTVKILFLLYAISLIMGVVNAYFPVERIRVFLTTRKLYGLQYFFAALFGAITPFCSCSSIPLFIGFVKGGIPLGVTFAFLITSPLVNEVAIAMFLGAFGIKITVIYVVSGILLGMVGGIVLEKFKLERYLSPWIRELLVQSNAESNDWERKKTPFRDKFPVIMRDAWGIVKGVTLYVDRHCHWGGSARLCACRILRRIHEPGKLVVGACRCHLCGTHVCKCCGYCSGDRGICRQGSTNRNGNCIHDGDSRTFPSGSRPSQEGDDLEVDRYFLRNGHGVHYSVGLHLQCYYNLLIVI